jgi:GR25 family glycosyltransferase involved in LPS biosynthesis
MRPERYETKVSNLYERFKHKFENHENGIDSLKGTVDKVYCISMPQRKDYITKKMNELGTSYTLLNAVTPDDLTPLDYEQLSDTYNPENQAMYKKITKLPLQVSFTVCMLDALKNNYETIIIFEDDITIEKDIQTIKKGIQQFKKSKYNLFYMGYSSPVCSGFNTVPDSDELVEVNTMVYCTHAIVYKKSILPKILDTIYPMKDYYDNLLLSIPYKCVPNTVYFDQAREDLGSLNEDEKPNNKLPTCSFRTPPELPKRLDAAEYQFDP